MDGLAIVNDANGREFAPLRLDQFSSQHFAHRTLRQLFCELYHVRHLVGRYACLERGADRLGKRAVAGPAIAGYDDGADAIADLGIGQRDHAGLGHGAMAA